MLAALFLLAHARDRMLLARAHFACLVLIGRDAGLDLRDLGIDLHQPRLGGLDPAALALHLAGQFGRAAVYRVEVALRIVARTLGFGLASPDRVDLAGERIDALLQFVNMLTHDLDFALTPQHAGLRATATQHARVARTDPLAGRRDRGLVRRKLRRETLSLVE